MTEEERELWERIYKALDLAVEYGNIDGSHHKDWVIDQMVRALTGCGKEESLEYKQLVANACDGVDGPDTYTWETGIAP